MTFDAQLLVARGVKALDLEFPGWDRKIDVDTLDIQFENKCLLAQLYGHHMTGLRNLGLGEEGDITHGFRHNSYSDVNGAEQYAALDAEWRRVISERSASVREQSLM
jgi:hypothetical protein